MRSLLALPPGHRCEQEAKGAPLLLPAAAAAAVVVAAVGVATISAYFSVSQVAHSLHGDLLSPQTVEGLLRQQPSLRKRWSASAVTAAVTVATTAAADDDDLEELGSHSSGILVGVEETQRNVKLKSIATRPTTTVVVVECVIVVVGCSRHGCHPAS